MEQAMASMSQNIACKPQAANNLGPPVAFRRDHALSPNASQHGNSTPKTVPTLNMCGTKLRLAASEKINIQSSK